MKTKQSLCTDIAILRRKISSLEEELEPFQENNSSFQQLKMNSIELRHKIKVLQDEHRNVRMAFDIYSHLNRGSRVDNFNSYMKDLRSSDRGDDGNGRVDSDYGWQMEAFLSIAGNVSFL